MSLASALPQVALLTIVALPALGGVVGRRRPLRAGPLTSGAAFVTSAALLVAVATRGPVSAVVDGPDGLGPVGLYADRVGALVLLLVTGVSTVVQSFAGRYLRGDARASRFFVATGILTSATAALATSATLLGIALAWSVAGAALLVLLGLYGDHPAARLGVRRTVLAFAVGDLALWLAVGVAALAWGGVDLRDLDTTAPQLAGDATALSAVALLLVVAALARSAQLPFQAWLPATLAAPTPVSALLHAGVVNAGGILLVRLSPLFGASAAATNLAFLAGAATLVYGTALMLTKTDVKGALALSTTAQMGFMIMTCGLGAYAAAIFHLVAHGMYKAALFLGSGSAVSRHVRHRKAPPARVRSVARARCALAFAVLVPGTVLAVATASVGTPAGPQVSATPLLIFAWATGTALTYGWLSREPTAERAGVAFAVTLLLAPAYVLLAHGVTTFLEPATAGGGTATVPMFALAPVLAILAATEALRLRVTEPAAARLHRRVYALVLGAAAVRSRRPLALGGRPMPSLAGRAVPQSQVGAA